MEFDGSRSGSTAPISSSFCNPHASQITISVKESLRSSRKYLVYDSEGQLLLSGELKSKSLFGHQQIVFSDPSGRILAVMQDRLSTWHYRWDVYRDKEANESSLLFKMRMAGKNIFSPSSEVYLLNNESKDPDFKAVGKGIVTFEYSILQGKSVIAEARQKGDDYILTVNPGVDLAFLSVFLVFVDQGIEAARRSA